MTRLYLLPHQKEFTNQLMGGTLRHNKLQYLIVFLLYRLTIPMSSLFLPVLVAVLVGLFVSQLMGEYHGQQIVSPLLFQLALYPLIILMIILSLPAVCGTR